MSPDNRVEQIVEAVSSGLKDDRELELDVRQELLSHIEETVSAYRSEGKPEEESVQLALKAFGAPEDIASELVTANSGKMRWRGIARMTLRAVLLPLAVIIALYVGFRQVVTGVFQAKAITAIDGNIFEMTGDGGKSGFVNKVVMPILSKLVGDDYPSPKEADDYLLLYGDPERKNRAEREKAIWEKYPDNKAYLGNYITAVLSDYGGMPQDERTQFEEIELRKGLELDPDNARYDYLIASGMISAGASLEFEAGKTDGELKILNRDLLDKALEELRAGGKKPYYRRYSWNMLGERLKILGAPETFGQLMRRLSMGAGILLPDLARLRNTVRVMMKYSAMLASEGNPEKADTIVQECLKIPVKLNEDAFTLIDILVVASTLKTIGDAAPAIYAQIGMPEKGEEIRLKALAMAQPVTDWRTAMKADQEGNQEYWQEFRKTAGILPALLLPVLGKDMLEGLDLKPGRQLEQVLVERAGLTFFLLLVLLMMAGTAFVTLRWRLAKGGASAPILLMPNLSVVMKAIVYGTLLPLMAYYVYTRWSGLAGREYSVIYFGPKFAVELLCLAAVMLYVPLAMMGNALRKRCEDLSIATTAPKSKWQRYAVPVTLGIAGIGSLLYHGAKSYEFGVIAGIAEGGLFIYLIAVLVAGLRGKNGTGLYHGTLARSSLPALAAAVIVTGILAGPYLEWREKVLVQSDPIFVSNPEVPGFTVPETKLTLKLKEEMAKAAVSANE